MSKPWCSIFLFCSISNLYHFLYITIFLLYIAYNIKFATIKNLILFSCFSLLHLFFIFFLNIARFFISFFYQIAVKGKRYPATLQFARKFVCSGEGVQQRKNSSPLAVFKGLNDVFPWMEERLRGAPFFLGASLGSRVPRVNRRWWAQGVTRHATHQRNRSHCLRVRP